MGIIDYEDQYSLQEQKVWGVSTMHKMLWYIQWLLFLIVTIFHLFFLILIERVLKLPHAYKLIKDL